MLLAASILGATVMPHAIYAHSALARDRFGGRGAPAPLMPGRPRRSRPRLIRRLLRATRLDVTIALVIAGNGQPRDPAARRREPAGRRRHRLVSRERTPRSSDGTGRRRSQPLFAVGLLASGLASTSVGAYAGAEIMQGLLRIRLPLLATARDHPDPGDRDPRRSASIRPSRSCSVRWCCRSASRSR